MEYAEGLGEIENSSGAYYEAEVMDLSFPMTLGTDTNAWGGEYISPPSGKASRSPLPEATLEFTALVLCPKSSDVSSGCLCFVKLRTTMNPN
jgi:hypothetical protein